MACDLVVGVQLTLALIQEVITESHKLAIAFLCSIELQLSPENKSSEILIAFTYTRNLYIPGTLKGLSECNCADREYTLLLKHEILNSTIL